MNSITPINLSTQMTLKLLEETLNQNKELVEKMIQMNVKNIIDIGQMENMGKIIDTYV